MKEQIDSQYRRPLKASITSTDQASLLARHEIRYLENLYGDAIDYSSHVNRRELREAFSLILFFGLLLLAAVRYYVRDGVGAAVDHQGFWLLEA